MIASVTRKWDLDRKRGESKYMRLVIAGVLFAFVAPAFVEAAILSTTYYGQVTPGFLVPGFTVGDLFRVTYTFDSATTDSSPGDPSIGQYTGAIQSLSFSVGQYSGFADSGANVQVGNNYTGQGGSKDYYVIDISASNLHGPPVSGWTLVGFVLQLVDPTGTALSSDALPPGALDYTKFVDPGTFMSLQFNNPGVGNSAVSAQFTAAPVPEPECGYLVISALSLILVAKQRFSRNWSNRL